MGRTLRKVTSHHQCSFMVYRWADKVDVRKLYTIYRVLEGIAADSQDELPPHRLEIFRVSLWNFRKELAMSKVGQKIIEEKEGNEEV